MKSKSNCNGTRLARQRASAKTKATAGGILPEFSKFDCLPGRAGGTPISLVTNTYRPMQARKKEIPKDGGKKVRVLSIPSIRDRVVQGALKLILEPIFVALGKARRRGN